MPPDANVCVLLVSVIVGEGRRDAVPPYLWILEPVFTAGR
jgi:hypothetical protein